MSAQEQNKALFHRWFGEAWNSGNYAVANEIIAPTMLVHGAGGQPVEMGPEGLAGLIKTWRDAFPDGHMSVDGLAAEGDLVAALLTWRGTHQGEFYGIPPTGKQIVCTSVGIDRMANGQVVAGWGELDMVGMMQQMGALPLIGPGAVAAGGSPEWGGSPTGAGAGAGTASREDNKAVMLRLIDAANQGGGDALLAIIDPTNYVEHNPVWGATDFESGARVFATLREAMPDLQVSIDQGIVIAEGDLVAVHALVQGTHTGAEIYGVAPSGKQVTFTHSDVARIAGGKIVERWVCSDTLSLLQQLGVLQSPE